MIGTEGEQLGIMGIKEALDLAESENLDLIKIAPKATPPVCKIMDYGKYKYELQKKEKENKKKQSAMQVKEIRLSAFIEEHDVEIKAKNAAKFLQEGDKVKVSLRFRGRERDYINSKGQEILGHFAEVLSDVGVMEKPPKLEGRNFSMFMVPKKNK